MSIKKYTPALACSNVTMSNVRSEFDLYKEKIDKDLKDSATYVSKNAQKSDTLVIKEARKQLNDHLAAFNDFIKKGNVCAAKKELKTVERYEDALSYKLQVYDTSRW